MIKLKTKKIILVSMLFLIIFCCCACGQINSMIVYNDDNSVDEIVTIVLNEEEVISAGYNYKELQQDIQARALIEINKFITALNDKISLDILTSSADKVALLNTYYNGIETINAGWKDEELVVGIKFKSVQIYKYFYNIPENVSSKPDVEQHFLYNKIMYRGNTLYLRHSQLYQNIKAGFEKVYPALESEQKGEILYTYVADIRREHSDADLITRIGNKYYHTWKLEPSDNTKEITIYYNVANKGNCILVAIGISFIALAILGMITVLKIKKNKSI